MAVIDCFCLHDGRVPTASTLSLLEKYVYRVLLSCTVRTVPYCRLKSLWLGKVLSGSYYIETHCWRDGRGI